MPPADSATSVSAVEAAAAVGIHFSLTVIGQSVAVRPTEQWKNYQREPRAAVVVAAE